MKPYGHYKTPQAYADALARLNATRSSRWRGRHRIPSNCHPVVRRLFEEMIRQRVLAKELGERAGLSPDTIRNWRTRAAPSLPAIEAALNALGLRLEVVKNAHRGIAP